MFQTIRALCRLPQELKRFIDMQDRANFKLAQQMADLEAFIKTRWTEAEPPARPRLGQRTPDPHGLSD